MSRTTLYSWAVIAAVVLGVAMGSYRAGQSQAGAEYSGDYPAFYGAGEIAASGDWSDLYSLSRQIDVQRDLNPEDQQNSARYFAYPPQVAFIYQPFAALDFHTSYLLHTLLMVLLLVATLVLARPMVPWLQTNFALGLALALVFWPMFRTITGGSNTALTLFLLVAAWRLVYDGHPLAGGLVIGGFFYKPQFAIPLVGLFLLRRCWRVVAASAAGGIAFYLSGVPLLGWDWVRTWFQVASDFGRFDAEINGHSAISLVGFTENIFGVGESGPALVAWALAAAVVLFLAWLWWRNPGTDLDRLLALAVPGMLLISPHAMSHDGALIVLTAGVAGSRWPMRGWLPWVIVVWLLGASQAAIKTLGFSPGFPMLLIVLVWGWLLVREQSTKAAGLQRSDEHPLP